jgi:MraZ protein
MDKRGRADAVLLGEYQHTLDAKGRVSLPAKFRAETTGKLVIAKGLDECLAVFPADSYQQFMDRLMTSDEFKGNTRVQRRHFAAGAVEAELDSAGRIKLPQVLCDYAHLGKEVAIIGNGDRIEIWDAKKWAKYAETAADNIEDFAEELADAGLP